MGIFWFAMAMIVAIPLATWLMFRKSGEYKSDDEIGLTSSRKHVVDESHSQHKEQETHGSGDTVE